MSKGKLKGKSQLDRKTESRIKSGSKTDLLDELLRFSFKFYDPDHEEFHCKDRDVEYFEKLLERVKDLSREKVSSLTNQVNRTTRFHPIDFRDKRIPVDGFGIGGWEEFEQDAWQFSLSKAENGRVHGFLIENVFYIVWLDPRHYMYSLDPNHKQH